MEYPELRAMKPSSQVVGVSETVNPLVVRRLRSHAPTMSLIEVNLFVNVIVRIHILCSVKNI